MGNDEMIQGWAVRSVENSSTDPPKYFMDIDNAIAYQHQQRNRNLLLIKMQPIRMERAEDLHQSRLRRAEKER